jgi:hypothetical protein
MRSLLESCEVQRQGCLDRWICGGQGFIYDTFEVAISERLIPRVVEHWLFCASCPRKKVLASWEGGGGLTMKFAYAASTLCGLISVDYPLELGVAMTFNPTLSFFTN